MKFKIFLLYIYYLSFVFSLYLKLPARNIVTLHLECFNERYNLLHVGISFDNNKEQIRFDYRPFNNKLTYLTTEEERKNAEVMFPLANMTSEQIQIFNYYRNELIFDTKDIYKKDVFWGITEKSQKEILDYERNILALKKYRIGIYDCRHYVNDFTIWCLDKKTPIWKLDQIWNKF